MVLQPTLERIPIWYTVKLIFVARLVLPQFRGAAFNYDKVLRHHLKRFGFSDGSRQHNSPNGNGKPKGKFVDFITHKKKSMNLKGKQ